MGARQDAGRIVDCWRGVLRLNYAFRRQNRESSVAAKIRIIQREDTLDIRSGHRGYKFCIVNRDADYLVGDDEPSPLFVCPIGKGKHLAKPFDEFYSLVNDSNRKG